MRSYLLKMLIALAIIITADIAIVLTVPAIIAAEYWMHETIVVKKSIASSLPSPRIIFLAGSSALFGIDAKGVEAGTGIPAVNMGLQANLPLDRVLDVGKSVARPGDVMVLALEPSYYECGQDNWTPWRLRNAIAWDRDYFDTLPLRRRVWIILSASDPTLAFEIIGDFVASSLFPDLYRRRLAAIAPPQEIIKRFWSGAERPSNFAYSAFNLDERGTMLHTQGSFTVDPGSVLTGLAPAAICPTTLEILSRFVIGMREKGVRTVFSHTPYMIDTFPGKGWQTSEALFARDVHSIGSELLENRKVMFFPRKDFFNFHAHLNEPARKQRTMNIVADLKRLGIFKR